MLYPKLSLFQTIAGANFDILTIVLDQKSLLPPVQMALQAAKEIQRKEQEAHKVQEGSKEKIETTNEKQNEERKQPRMEEGKSDNSLEGADFWKESNVHVIKFQEIILEMPAVRAI